MERGDYLTLFVKVANLCEPDHKYDIEYPIDESDVKFSWTSKYWAKCGPRHNGAYFAINNSWAGSVSTERMLAVMCHEIGHFNYGITKNQPTHGPDFWEAMARYGVTCRNKWNVVQTWFNHNVDIDEFVEEVVNDPNSALVDNRIETVEERKNEQAELMGRNPSKVVR